MIKLFPTLTVKQGLEVLAQCNCGCGDESTDYKNGFRDAIYKKDI